MQYKGELPVQASTDTWTTRQKDRRSRISTRIAPHARDGSRLVVTRASAIKSLLATASPATKPRMKVFVTGGAGYVGSVCVEELLDAG